MFLRPSRIGALAASILAAGALAACSSAVYTRVTSEVASESGTVFTLENRDRLATVTFPQGWRSLRMDRQPDGAVGDDLIVRGAPRGAFALGAAVPSFPDGTPTAENWEYEVLEELRLSLYGKSPAEYVWVDGTWTTVTGGPALQTTIILKDGSVTRDTYFFHDELLFTASFVAEEDGFEELWPAVEQALRGLTFKS